MRAGIGTHRAGSPGDVNDDSRARYAGRRNACIRTGRGSYKLSMTRLAAWILLTLTVATVGAGGASLVYTVGYQPGPLETVELSFGSIRYEKRRYLPRCAPRFPEACSALSVYRNDRFPWAARLQLLLGQAVTVGSGAVNVPLWIPAVLFGGVAGWLMRRGKRRSSAGYRAAGGYDLTGNVSGRCSECGAVTERCG